MKLLLFTAPFMWSTVTLEQSQYTLLKYKTQFQDIFINKKVTLTCKICYLKMSTFLDITKMLIFSSFDMFCKFVGKDFELKHRNHRAENGLFFIDSYCIILYCWQPPPTILPKDYGVTVGDYKYPVASRTPSERLNVCRTCSFFVWSCPFIKPSFT